MSPPCRSRGKGMIPKVFAYSEPLVFRIKAIIIPYRPRTSEKMRIKTIPTNSLGWCMNFLTPTSPTIPMA